MGNDKKHSTDKFCNRTHIETMKAMVEAELERMDLFYKDHFFFVLCKITGKLELYPRSIGDNYV
jgi:hypothetical protein